MRLVARGPGHIGLDATAGRQIVFGEGGSTALKVIGFFSSAAVVTTFDGILSPLGTSTIVIGAPHEEPALAQ